MLLRGGERSFGQEELAAAVGYSGTLLFFTNAINIGLSIAAGSLVARSIGADENQAAREYAMSVAIFASVIGIIFPIMIMLNLSALLQFLGAEGITLDYAVRYSSIILPTMAFMGLAMVLMTLEKLPDIGRHLTRPLGAILIAAGLAIPLF